jgi:TolB-like protein/Tfp pilus assembly protein PilF
MKFPPQRIRFGVFQVDTQSGELRREGSKVHLQEQPFQVLLLLLEHAGEVVSREEFYKKLWAENTYVDSERGLNKAINKLRIALGDGAGNPNHIETLPQRGYRFIAPIQFEAQRAGNQQVASRINSVAVLPLENMSGDPAQEYFSDGMTEELTYALAKTSSLRVISRTSVMQYKGARKALPVIAEELSVDAIVEGSVLRSGQRVRITVQLIHAKDDRHIWSGKYEQDLRDILKLQAEVAQNIAAQIQKLVEPGELPLPQPRQVHPEAYEACLLGSFVRDKMSPIDLQKSLDLFQKAIQLDPNYARAFGELSQSYFYLGIFGVAPPTEMFPKAREAASRALQLDGTVASAYNAMAAVHIFYDWDWVSAEAKSRKAVELSPGESVTHVHLADYLSIRGRHREAIETYANVFNLDPITRIYRAHYGLILYRARRFQESIIHCQKALDLDPIYANALWFMALSLEQTGDLTGSISRLETAAALSPASFLRALLARAYAIAGQTDKALAILAELRALSDQRYVSPFDFAVVYHGLGDLASTFEWLERAYAERVFRLIELTFPMFDGLRSSPQWHDLVRRVGLQV